MSLLRSIAKLLPEGEFKESLRKEYHDLIARRVAMAHGCDLEYNRSDQTCSLRFNTGILKGFSMVAPLRGVGSVYPASYELPNYFLYTGMEPGTVFIDAGSFPGDFALAARWLVPRCKVFAFEPDPKNRQYLEEVIDLNGARGQVEVLPFALSSGSAVLPMAHKKAGSYILGVNSSVEQGLESFPVESTSLDGILPSLLGTGGRVPFVKMDIEGHELEACAGAQRTLRMGATFAIACYHVVDGRKTLDSLVPIFRERGYSLTLSDDVHLTLIALHGKAASFDSLVSGTSLSFPSVDDYQ